MSTETAGGAPSPPAITTEVPRAGPGRSCATVVAATGRHRHDGREVPQPGEPAGGALPPEPRTRVGDQSPGKRDPVPLHAHIGEAALPAQGPQLGAGEEIVGGPVLLVAPERRCPIVLQVRSEQ